MVVVRKGEGERFVPDGHAKMEAEKLFGPANGFQRATIHLSTLHPGGGMEEEVHDSSDQVFYVLSESILARAGGEDVSVRKNAEDRVFAVVGSLKRLKKKKMLLYSV